ncbi:hypothetical protein C5167_016650 [Papaver somniferum]|nr:hypothetical protein C5167_016650 [Papaver somniferum]
MKEITLCLQSQLARKHGPGNKRLQKKRRLDDLHKFQSGDIVNYFKPPSTTDTENTAENNNSTINSGKDDNHHSSADDNGAKGADDNGTTRDDDDFADNVPNIIENDEAK